MLPTDVSGVILTKNEEEYLPAALHSLSWCKERLVVDSLSTDRTTQIAAELGARVIVHPFNNHGEQYNVGIDGASCQWVFLLDADERVPEALSREVTRELREPKATAYYIPRRNYFFGRWIRYGGLYPDASIRLLKKGSARYEIRQAHPRVIAEGPVGRLREPISHHAYRGMNDYLDKLNRYTSWHAIVRLDEKQRRRTIIEVVRSRASPWHKLRDLTALWPARPVLRFILQYFVRLGFLDGRPGFRLAFLAAVHEYLTSLKVAELETAPKTPNQMDIKVVVAEHK